MAGIYIHVPFCKQACHYCDFHFSTSLNLKADYLKSIKKEIELRADDLKGEISTVYFGGGTPSILNAKELKSILDALSNHFTISEKPEITLEANPDDLNLLKLRELFAAGINRLSIGVQSLNNKSLEWMNRAHNVAEARQSILDAQKVGFDNLSIDLIYGLPNLSLAEWERELKEIFSFEIQHLSAYCLTVEANTALGHWVRKGQEKPVDEDAANRQFQRLVVVAMENGLEQYEVSNFGKEGFYSRHNTSYWQGIPYLGLGPSAHSYIDGTRSWNVANNARYIKSIQENKLPLTSEVLSRENRVNEYIMTGLRTKWGIDLDKVKSSFDYDLEEHYSELIKELVEKNLAEIQGRNFVLTKTGLFMADGIASDFFILEHDH